MMTIHPDDMPSGIDMIREGDIEDVAEACGAVLERLGRMTPGELATVASLLRDHGGFGDIAIDAMTDVMLSL